METVNGRNFQGLSNSDYDPGHRINAYISKKFSYLKGLMATTVSLVYNAQSGNTYSYVMNRGMVRDLDNFETNDLIYVPPTAEISSMVFLTNGALTAAQQRTAYDDFLNQDPYLRKIRGQ